MLKRWRYGYNMFEEKPNDPDKPHLEADEFGRMLSLLLDADPLRPHDIDHNPAPAAPGQDDTPTT